MKNLYVGNLPHSTTETELRTLFQPHGEVERVSMVTDRRFGGGGGRDDYRGHARGPREPRW
jgi:hypothetical protein